MPSDSWFISEVHVNSPLPILVSGLLAAFCGLKNAPLEQTAEGFARVIRREVLFLGLRLFGGVVLTSLIILSLIHMAEAVEAINSQFNNGPIFSLLGFGAAATIGSVALYLALRPTKIKQPAAESHTHIDFELIALKFAEGVAEGLNRPPPVTDARP